MHSSTVAARSVCVRGRPEKSEKPPRAPVAASMIRNTGASPVRGKGGAWEGPWAAGRAHGRQGACRCTSSVQTAWQQLAVRPPTVGIPSESCLTLLKGAARQVDGFEWRAPAVRAAPGQLAPAGAAAQAAAAAVARRTAAARAAASSQGGSFCCRRLWQEEVQESGLRQHEVACPPLAAGAVPPLHAALAAGHDRVGEGQLVLAGWQANNSAGTCRKHVHVADGGAWKRGRPIATAPLQPMP